jgi:hypothetical protein
MAVTLGQGFRPYLLAALKDITGNAAYPGYKLDPHGFLNLLQSQAKPNVLKLNTAGGHKNTVQVKYKQRLTKDFTDTAKSCDNTVVIPTAEVPVDLSVTRQVAIYVEDETIAKFMDDASRSVAIGQPATEAANAILDGVNDDLLTLAVANIGFNRVTGSAAAKTVNFPLNTTNLPLNAGLTEVLSDYKINGGMGRPQIIGSGLMHNFMLQQGSKSADQSGFDTKIQAAGVDFYHDLSATTILGSNQVIAYEPNAVQLVEYLEYTGFKAGFPGAGNSIFGTMALPMQVGLETLPVEFDWQLRYSDCQQTLTDAYYGTSLTLQKGWNFIISKQCGLFTVPSGAYRATDAMKGNRGSYRYTITNV